MKKALSVAFAALLVVLALSLIAQARTTHGSRASTVTVIEHAKTDKVIDVGKKGDSTGDILTFHNDLYDETDTTKVGTDQGQCTRMSPKDGTWECWWTTSLQDGQITIEGPYLDASNTVLAAVTGGTGQYENARGTMEASCKGSECTMTFKLIP